MTNASLRYTFLFTSALQVLGSDHDVSRQLERAVRTHDPEALAAGERAIKDLNEADRQTLLDRFDELWDELPLKARAAWLSAESVKIRPCCRCH
jgi:hypothetical protein